MKAAPQWEELVEADWENLLEMMDWIVKAEVVVCRPEPRKRLVISLQLFEASHVAVELYSCRHHLADFLEMLGEEFGSSEKTHSSAQNNLYSAKKKISLISIEYLKQQIILHLKTD